MKSLTEYSKENINEGLGDFLKKAWRWLIGKREEKYNPTSIRYNEKAKTRYINQYSSKEIEIKDITESKVLIEIVKKSLNKEDEKVGFFKLEKLFRSNPKYKFISDTNKYIALVFKTEKLSESCGLIGYSTDIEGFDGKPVVYISEFLAIYKYLIDYNAVTEKLKEIDEHMIIKDSYLYSQLVKNDIDVEPVEGKKDVYRLK